MSGYRTLHREQILEINTAIWSIQSTKGCRLSTITTSSSPTASWRLWVGSSDGYVRSYFLVEGNSNRDGENDSDPLNASALTVSCTHALISRTQAAPVSPVEQQPSIATTSLGCTQVCTIRNYVGEDTEVGDLVVSSLELSGIVRVWTFANDWEEMQAKNGQCSVAVSSDNDETTGNPVGTVLPQSIRCRIEFSVENSTGTTMLSNAIPSLQQVVVAVGCLDGTVAIVATGISTPNATKEPSSSGTVIDSWGSLGASIPMCMAWYPAESEALVVGRQDGVVDIISSKGKSHHHRLLRLTSSPVRAVSFSGDGSLLVAGNDAGMICVWDISGNRKSQPTLVHHIVQAHKSWILGLCFFSDHRRFVSIGAERQIHIWNVGQLSQPVHTFQLDSSVWTVSLLPPNNRHSSDEQAPRLITGSDDGLIQIFSIAKQ